MIQFSACGGGVMSSPIEAKRTIGERIDRALSDAEREQVRERMTRDRQLLDSGSIGDPKQLQSIQAELDSLAGVGDSGIQGRLSQSDRTRRDAEATGIEEINKALKSKVWLKSGGYIVIDEAEALVVIELLARGTARFDGSHRRRLGECFDLARVGTQLLYPRRGFRARGQLPSPERRGKGWGWGWLGLYGWYGVRASAASPPTLPFPHRGGRVLKLSSSRHLPRSPWRNTLGL